MPGVWMLKENNRYFRFRRDSGIMVRQALV
jgi:hypothetical protein